MDVEVTPLPGIGTRQDFVTESGRRIGVVTHRDGQFELIVSKQADPDACAASIPLSQDESRTLANLLGAPAMLAQLAEQRRGVTDVSTAQLPIAPGSPFDGKTLEDIAMRTRTGSSVVAVVRAGQLHKSPGSDFVLTGGDLVVVVGSQEGLAAATDMLDQG